MTPERFKKDFERIKEEVFKFRRILIVSHVNPDGDSVGSSLGFYHFLKGQGRRAEVFVPGGVPANFRILPGANAISDRPPSSYDLVIALDYGDWIRTGLKGNIPEEKIITIDHHPFRTQRGKVKLIDLNVSSTCEIIYFFLEYLGAEIDRNIAFCLLTGIITDTGGLKHESTQVRTFEVVKKLILKGAPLEEVTEMTNPFRSLKILRFWGRLISSIVFCSECKLAYIAVDKKLQEEFGATAEDVSGIVSLVATIPQARVSAVLVEDKGEIRVSLRTESDRHADVSQIAQKLGGGGHKLASGFTSKLPMEETIEGLKREIKKAGM